jgi:hypothetical protein
VTSTGSLLVTVRCGKSDGAKGCGRSLILVRAGAEGAFDIDSNFETRIVEGKRQKTAESHQQSRSRSELAGAMLGAVCDRHGTRWIDGPTLLSAVDTALRSQAVTIMATFEWPFGDPPNANTATL